MHSIWRKMFFHLYNSSIFLSFQILIGTSFLHLIRWIGILMIFFFVCFNLHVRISFGVFSKDPFTPGASLIHPILVGFFGSIWILRQISCLVSLICIAGFGLIVKFHKDFCAHYFVGNIWSTDTMGLFLLVVFTDPLVVNFLDPIRFMNTRCSS